MQHYSFSKRIIYHALNRNAPSAAYKAPHALVRQRILIIKSMPNGWPSVLEITPLGIEQLHKGRADREVNSDEVTQ